MCCVKPTFEVTLALTIKQKKPHEAFDAPDKQKTCRLNHEMKKILNNKQERC